MFRDYLKTLPQYLAPKGLLTRFAGFMANIQIPAIKNHLISRFVVKYKVNMSEAREENPLKYACFNDFFIRHLKAETRPMSSADIVSPVDGCVSELGPIEAGQIVQAKGRYYTVNELLACDPERANLFQNGQFATLYLSPKDYHRIHMPIKGTLKDTIYVPGRLFSVQPTTARTVPQLFARNERLVTFFETEAGLMAMVLVGATIVGSIGTAWQGDLKRSTVLQHTAYSDSNTDAVTLEKGAEMGYFKLGSTVILLFANGQQVNWQQSLKAGDAIKFGESLAAIS